MRSVHFGAFGTFFTMLAGWMFFNPYTQQGHEWATRFARFVECGFALLYIGLSVAAYHVERMKEANHG